VTPQLLLAATEDYRASTSDAITDMPRKHGIASATYFIR
jgi:hypothetical protein